MGARTKARKRALDILFESELRGLDTGATLAGRREAVDALNSYTVTLVEGVVAHRDEIDELLGAHSEAWPLERMPAVDRNLLRIGVFELRYVDEVPDAVAMSEAVSLARELSTDESPAFVNGLLAKIAGLPAVAPHEQETEDTQVEPPTLPDEQLTSRVTPGLGDDRDAALPS
ncbi:MAG: transcription antitermination factor NusB [Nocardioidaceae bacterium]|nr:transcription antitermination factor NusB [Nocardioidaceae bacterium]